MRENCPVCGNLLVRPNGWTDADILIVGDFPGQEEIQAGLPFVGDAGKVLAYEMAVTGLSLQMCRVTNLWLHNKTNNDKCRQFGISRLLTELIVPRKGVLFLGIDVAQSFGIRLEDYCGVPISSIPVLNLPVLCVFTYNPAVVFHTANGEFRLSLQKFRKAVKNHERVDNHH